jgi:hypothetical protein
MVSGTKKKDSLKVIAYIKNSQPGNSMTPLRTTFTFLLVLTCVLIIAGCIWQQPAENRTSNISMNVTTFTPVITSVQTSCLPQKNTTPWIAINPISDYYVGEVFEINGTTNLGADENISIDIIQSYFSPKGQDYFTGFHGHSRIIGSDCGVNKWSISVNLSEFIPFEYFVHVSEANEMINCSAVFKVFESSSKPFK